MITVTFLVAVAGALGYLLFCRLSPLIDCKKCDGRGRVTRWHGFGKQPCKYCEGEGQVSRTGALVLNRLGKDRRMS